MKTSVNTNNIESKKVQLDDPKGKVNAVYNAIIEAIKGDRMIGRHIAQTYGTNGPRPVYGIEVWESIVYVHTDTDRRIFGKAIDRLLKAHEDLFKWADFQKASEEGPHIVLALTDETVKAKKEEEKAIREAEKAAKVNTSWATDFTPEDFEKLTSRYEIADEDRDIVGRRFHTGEGLWTIDVFVSDYAGNEAHALIYLLTGEGEVRANVLSLDHLRQTLTEAKGWTRTA